MTKYFVFMYVDDTRLRNYLNLAIFLLNPEERWPAHVTIAGPFNRREAVPRTLEFSQEVFVLGRGRFLNGQRHTVYLHVGSRDMRSRVAKPDYPNAIPHLTLYNGEDERTAEQLYAGLEKTLVFGQFNTSRLEIVDSKQYRFDSLESQIHPDLLPWTQGRTLNELKSLDLDRRVNLALAALRIGFRRPTIGTIRLPAFGS
jgi:hypothetical protein